MNNEVTFFLRVWTKNSFNDGEETFKKNELLCEDVILTRPLVRRGIHESIYHVMTYDGDHEVILEGAILEGIKRNGVPSLEYFIFWKDPDTERFWYFNFISAALADDPKPKKKWIRNLEKVDFWLESSCIETDQTKWARISDEYNEITHQGEIESVSHITRYNVNLDKILNTVVTKGTRRGAATQVFVNCMDRNVNEGVEFNIADGINPERFKHIPRHLKNIRTSFEIWTQLFADIFKLR